MKNYLDKLDLTISNLWFSKIKENKQLFNIEIKECKCMCHNNKDNLI